MKSSITKLAISFTAFSLIQVASAAFVIQSPNTPITGQITLSNKVPLAKVVGDNNSYTSLNKALQKASTTANKIVYLIPPTLANYHDTDNPNIPDKVEYEIDEDITIPNGVTLIIPTDNNTISSVTDSTSLASYIKSMEEDDSSHGKTTGDRANENNTNIDKYQRVTLRLKAGKTITNNGNLVISGYLSSGVVISSGRIGQTTYSYSRILMERGSSIIQNNSSANTYCYGYIEEDSKDNQSKVNIANGMLYIPLVIKDYKGFTSSWAMTYSGGAIDQGCSPFNQFEFQNISSEITCGYNCEVIGKVNLYFKYNNPSVEKHFYDTISLLSNKSTSLVQLNSANYSSFNLKYDGTLDGKYKIKIYGGCKINNLRLSFDSGVGIKINLTTTTAYFPISYAFDIELLKGRGQTGVATFDATSQKIKLLPGSSFTINDGCTLNGSSLSVYSSFHDGSPYASEGNKYQVGNPYPLKDGATLKIIDSGKINMSSSLAGLIYCDSNDNYHIVSTSNSIASKEPWSYANSGAGAFDILGGTPAYKITDYLEIKEQLEVRPLIDLNKNKLFVGLNTFTSTINYLPALDVFVNDETTATPVNGFQKVIIYDSDITTYHLDFVSNIYKAFNNTSFYRKNSTITYNTNNSKIGAINSIVSVSNNNNGVNEFNAQSMNIECTTPLVNGNYPLYVDSNIQLRAVINDYNKAYGKNQENIVWTSSDPSIATVQATSADKGLTAKVTGVSLGQATITATYDGISATFIATVIPDEAITPIESIYISNDKNSKTSADTPSGSGSSLYHYQSGNNNTITFTLHINPTDAPYSSIKWELINISGVLPDRQSMVDDSGNDIATQIVENQMSCKVKIKSGSGASPDYVKLVCTVTDLSGQQLNTTFYIEHKADVNIPCITGDTLISLYDGRKKRADELTFDDDLLVFDHYKGVFTHAKMFFNYHANEDNTVTNYILHLLFEDGQEIKVHVDHGFFDLDLNKYVYINKENYKEFIGHYFLQVTVKDKKQCVSKNKLISANLVYETVKVYSPVSIYHLNIVTEDMLSITGEITGWFNFFKYDEDYKYDEEEMKRDIERYGLYTYEDFDGLLRKEIFDILPMPYLKISASKGVITFEDILKIINKYLSDK